MVIKNIKKKSYYISSWFPKITKREPYGNIKGTFWVLSYLRVLLVIIGYVFYFQQLKSNRCIRCLSASVRVLWIHLQDAQSMPRARAPRWPCPYGPELAVLLILKHGCDDPSSLVSLEVFLLNKCGEIVFSWCVWWSDPCCLASGALMLRICATWWHALDPSWLKMDVLVHFP